MKKYKTSFHSDFKYSKYTKTFTPSHTFVGILAVEGKNSDEISRIEKNITYYYINKILSMSSLLIGRYNYNSPKKHKGKNNNNFFKKNCGNKR